jgi:DNA-binding IclR family transcriptional regulator
MESTHLTVHLAAPENSQAVLIAKFDPPGSSHMATWCGKIMGMHCTALGKAIGAFLSDEQIEQFFRTHGFPRNNENTHTSLRRVRDDYSQIRQRMYSIDDEEEELGYRCLGAPILGTDGSIGGAISIAGTTMQINGDNLPRLADKLKTCAGAISLAGGYTRNEHAYFGA